MKNEIYILDSIPDEPQFEGFAFKDKTSLQESPNIYADFVRFDRDLELWRPNRLSNIWKPREVVGNVRPENDYPKVSWVPAFSQRAVDALRDLLEPNGELLPLKTPAAMEIYYAFNILTSVDAIDRKLSDRQGMNQPRTAMDFKRHEFIPEKVVDLSIFRVPHGPYDTYVTEIFAERARERGLRGMVFGKVWPLPSGSDWYQLRKEQLRNLRARAATRPPKNSKSEIVGKIACRPLGTGEELTSLSNAISSYSTELGFNIASMNAADVQQFIYESLIKLRSSRMTNKRKIDRSFWLAIAWGEALVKTMRWEWTMLEDQGGHKTLAIVSDDRSRVVPVLRYFERLATDQSTDLSSLLLYNLIKNEQIPNATPGELKLLA